MMHGFPADEWRFSRTNAPWGLQRITQAGPVPASPGASSLGYSYTYDDRAGEGVDVYVLDTVRYTSRIFFDYVELTR